MFADLPKLNPGLWRAQRAFRRQRAAFFVDAAQVLGSVKLTQILSLQINSARGTPLGDAFAEIKQRFSSGKSLSQCFAGFVTASEELALTGWDAAESDEVLAEGFRKIGQIATAFNAVRAQMKRALLQATTSALLAFALLWMMQAQVYPAIIDSFPVANWITPARVCYFLINALMGDLPMLLLGIGLTFAIYIWSLDHWTSSMRRRLDHTLLYGWWRSYRSLAVLLALALHLKAHRGVNDALRLVDRNTRAWEHWYLSEMLMRNRQGKTGGEVIDVGFFDQQITNRLLLLSAAGSMESAAEQIAFVSQRELLEAFRERIDLAGKASKNAALVVGVIPIALFFTTMSDFIVHALQGSAFGG